MSKSEIEFVNKQINRMSDLISREMLLKEFNQTAIEWLQDGTYQLQFAAGVMCEVMEMVTKAPTIDAVEVVRCGKCVHFDTDWAYCGSDVHYCKKHKCARRESEFCSDGE